MKQFLRDFFIQVCTVLGIVALYRFLIRRRGPLVRVVVFHDVVSHKTFERIMHRLHAEYNVLTPKDFLEKNFTASKINVLLTFDDGYDSWVETCLLVLEKYNCKGLFFINSGLLDLHNDPQKRELYVRHNLMLHDSHSTISWDGVASLVAHGHSIGGHTAGHKRLSTLSKDQLSIEIGGDKKRIESKLHEEITTFAYPFGNENDYTSESQAVVRESGYNYAFTTEPSFVYGTDPYTIPRLCLDDTVTARNLALWIEGGYDLYAKVKKLCVG